MREFFITLIEDLMPEQEKPVDHDAEVKARHERLSELGRAEWRVKQAKGSGLYDPSPREIWEEADRA